MASIKILLNWVWKDNEAGVEGLEESRRWTKYSKELKGQAVADYLNGLESLQNLTEKYGISDPCVLRFWIKRYTSVNELKATSKGMSRMKQGRKTTFEERGKYLEMENGLLKKLEEIKRRNDGKAWSPLENLPSDKRICE